MNKKQIQVMIAGALATVSIPNGMQKAHGVGLDGVTKVDSLEVGQSPEHPGKHFVRDTEGNSIVGTPHELFVAVQAVAEKEGSRITAIKI